MIATVLGAVAQPGSKAKITRIPAKTFIGHHLALIEDGFASVDTFLLVDQGKNDEDR